jgi:DNA-binding transcriptional MerR regulator
MFKIGDFSRIARVSCRLLRYYDELGLLKTAIVDRESGYRFYGAAQLPQLNRILVLKELGLTLDQIGRATSSAVSADELRAMLLIRRSDVEQALAAESERLRLIETRISQIETTGQLSADDVLLRTEPAKRVLTARRIVRSFTEGREAIQNLVASVPRHVSRASLGQIIAIAHSTEFEPDSIDLEFGFAVSDDFSGTGLSLGGTDMKLHELPPVKHMAVCVRIGPPEHAHLVTAKVGQFVEDNGYVLAGPSREVFLQAPQPDRMEAAVIEMQYPVESMR